MRGLLLSALLLAAPASALPSPDELSVLYGHGLPAANGSRRLGQRYSFVSQSLTWTRGRGAVSLGVMGGRFYRPSDGGLAGAELALELRTLRWLAVEAGSGSVWTDFHGLEMRQNFELFAGVTARIPVSRILSLRLGYRFHHFSNAGLRKPNSGLNGHVPYAGLSVRL